MSVTGVSASATPEPSEPPGAIATVTATVAGPTVTPEPRRPALALTEPVLTDRFVVVGVAPDDVLYMRASPGLNGEIVLALPPPAVDLQITGPFARVDDARWVPVTYQGVSGYVNRNFLAVQVGIFDPAVLVRSTDVLQALKRQDMQALAAWVHPIKGLRFAPYAFQAGGGLTLSAGQVAGLAEDPTVYTISHSQWTI